ncbi:CPBP family intramembrane glutamic endopeptidase [Terrisporobacter glycolicus]|uniref:CAAX prenyl protease 2/Lysostaphin resistance protein A-like domain-containing protein n=1 Tax=Terrisporobacter glycolicus ATCC 14880 = DSM 1288 TaxID=1121315 RepID=A0ABZ2EX96_9FIRM|nr:type II CAAX endopeptidase family protein [Terrisporobacter glycolicus]
MSKKKAGILVLMGYLITMGIGILIGNVVSNILGENVLGTMNMNLNNIIYKFIIQIPPTVFIIYFIKKYYNWEDIYLSSKNLKSFIWFVPYLIVLIFIIGKFITELSKHISTYDRSIYLMIIIIFTGTAMAGFCEEVIFRGIILNSFKSEKSYIMAMIISSLGFSIVHITTIVMGNSLFEALVTVFYSSLLGFAFVGLAMKMKNIWPLIIFHSIWNFILIASQSLQFEISIAAGICNIMNIFMAIILWVVVIVEEKRKNRRKTILTN